MPPLPRLNWRAELHPSRPPSFKPIRFSNARRLIRTNLDGAFYCIHAVLAQMLERKDGVIVSVNSISGKRPHPEAGAGYAAGKFGLNALAGYLANEELEGGIRVSSIFPAAIDTTIRLTRPTPDTAEQQTKMLRPEDVANAVLFVATLPPHVSVPELIIKPTAQNYLERFATAGTAIGSGPACAPDSRRAPVMVITSSIAARRILSISKSAIASGDGILQIAGVQTCNLPRVELAICRGLNLQSAAYRG